MDGWMMVTAMVSAVALALDYMRQRRLDEATVHRLHEGQIVNTHAIHEQARRIDMLAARVDHLEDPGGLGW